MEVEELLVSVALPSFDESGLNNVKAVERSKKAMAPHSSTLAWKIP